MFDSSTRFVFIILSIMTALVGFALGLFVGLFLGWLGLASLQAHISKPVRDE